VAGWRIRPAGPADAPFLALMLGEAASPGRRGPDEPPLDVLADPALAPYVAGWPRPGDLGVVAECGGEPVGAAWARRFPPDAPAYGFVRADVPELAIATVPGLRGRGLGRALLEELIDAAARAGVPALSLSVRRDNPARHLYARLGFTVVGGSGDSDTMLLDPLVPAVREELLPLRGGRMRLLRAGPAGSAEPPLVLVHGGGPDSADASWSALLGDLARDRTVLAPDLPGVGGTSGVPVQGPPAATADLLVEAAAAAGAPRAVWVGVSMGGHVALQAALRHPDAVVGLVLVAPGGLVARAGSRPAHVLAWLASLLPDAVLLPALRLANRFAGVAVRAMVHDPRTVPAPVRAAAVREARRPGSGRAYLRYNQATLGPWRMRDDLRDRVGAITAPALLLHGRQDRLVPLRGSVVAAATMRRARLVTVERCGHWVQVEHPEVFLAEVHRFLRELGPAGRTTSGEAARGRSVEA
jgi:pimeloyl-ACP methyl ester carboxylesterase/ribosomal protein S18 acetylase RimI-like enzyme